MTSFVGRHIVVTGGTGALGAAVVGRLLRDGATVHVPEFADSLPDGYPHAEHERFHWAPNVDLTVEAVARSFYDACPPLWGSVQVAGGFAMAALVDTDGAEFRRMHEINTVSCFLACREAVRRIRATGLGGRLVNVAARPGLVATAGMLAYAVSKAGVVALTRGLAEELRGDGILVNAVVPSIMNTPDNRAAMPDADHSQWPSVDEVAGTIAYLVSTDNSLSSGALIPVYGQA